MADAPGDPAHNLLGQSTFESGRMLPWTYGFYADAKGEARVREGALCAHLERPGSDPWNAQFRHREIVVEQGHHYVISFRTWASRKTTFSVKVGKMGAPYTDFVVRSLEAGPAPRAYALQFTMSAPDEPAAEVAFHFGGRMVQGEGPLDLCVDDTVLSDPEFEPQPVSLPPAVPSVRVNQLGYLPAAPKFAAWVTDQVLPRAFRVRDSAGAVVFEGASRVMGSDDSSGDAPHWLDFSPLKLEGVGYVVEVDGERSDPFRISRGLYADLQRDAFSYFYHNRSGADIVLPYAGQSQWTRPAGHRQDVASCAPDATCQYSLDVTGGWYDAGDHGKYVVNGGISAWTLMNWFERTSRIPGAKQVFSDLSGLIPESGNGIPDILDEARWELEFLLRMQVPVGHADAGMVHHKVHDDRWTELATAPHQDLASRFLRPVSTAATLNLAATAAQAARLFEPFDAAFAARCIKAAKRAYAAAKANPRRYAPEEDSTGGGAYADDDVGDEFFWAAAELFLTTGGAEYGEALTPQALAEVARAGDLEVATPITWSRVGLLGTISLALAADAAAVPLRASYRAQVVQAAERLVKLTDSPGYRLPFAGGLAGYPSGSNSFVINNMLVIALAYDVTQERRFFDAVVLGFDYLLGRNALGKSYISGYGARPLTSPHHRFWARGVHPEFPPPFPGALAGGPSSGLEDPYVKAAGLSGCAPQKCYLDHVEAWSVNEVGISRNAPLVWVAAWLAEHSS